MKKFVFVIIACGIGVFIALFTFFPMQSRLLKSFDVIGYIGIILTILSIFYGTVFLNHKISAYSRCISSKYLPVTKFFVPVIVLVILLFDLALIVFRVYPGDEIAPFMVCGFMFFIWLLILIPEMRSQIVCIKGNKLFITNYFKNYNISINEILEVKRYYYLIYKIKTNNKAHQSILFRPKLQIFGPLALFKKPDSVKELIKFIDQNRDEKRNDKHVSF